MKIINGCAATDEGKMFHDFAQEAHSSLTVGELRSVFTACIYGNYTYYEAIDKLKR